VATIKKGRFTDGLPDHPELHELFMIVAYGDPFVVAQGDRDGVPYVIVTSGNSSSHFTFTKCTDGYLLEKTK
jgi:hypothetical protein